MFLSSSRSRRIRRSACALLAWLSGCLAPVPGFCGASEFQAPTVRPNVLLILTDDQGYGDFSLHGNTQLETPVLDRLAREGIQWDRFYVSPVCAPTRASLLTGRYSLRTGVWGVTHGKETIRSEEITLAEALRSSGYRTGIFGKWHNGEHYPYTPQGQGFDEFFGFRNGHWTNYFDTVLERNGAPVRTRGYITDVLTEEASAFIERNRARPFFCYVAYNAPHSPFQLPDQYFRRFKASGLDDTLASVYGMCANIDDNVGRLLALLDRLGLAENTIVVFSTDNGPNTNRLNAGMRGRKGSVHEGGVRVPLFLRWPAGFAEPRRISEIAAHIDLFPTILDLCGIPLPGSPALDGLSLRPLMEGRSQEWPDRLIFTHHVRGPLAPAMFPGAVRTQRHLLVNDGSGYRLFDMQADPGQTRDIASDFPAVSGRLVRAYEDWYRDVSRPAPVRLPIPVGYPQENPVVLPAPQAYLEGRLRFEGEAGYAHDWITGWSGTDARVSWQIDVVTPGSYRVSLGYLCPRADAGSRIRVTVGEARLEATVPGTPMEMISSPDRVPRRSEVYEMRWADLPLGTVHLPGGRHRLSVEALTLSDSRVMELKHARLERED